MTHTNLWAPWRMAYINSLEGEADAAGLPDPSTHACFLCEAIQTLKQNLGHADEHARERLVLLHDPRGLIILNRYPYTNGHLLIAPNDHLGNLTDLSPTQRCDLMELTELAERLLRTAVNPQGINIGINLGRCAGAGLPGHLHVHLVPRWNGDTNFMQTVGRVRVIPQAIEESYAHLRAILEQLA